MSNNRTARLESRREFIKQGALSAFATVCLPTVAFRSREARADQEGNDVVLRCCVMSDVHFNGSETAAEVDRFKRAVKFMYDYSADQKYKNFDALVVVGDMTNHGNDKELPLFKKTMDEVVKEGTAKLVCMGNHEFYGGNQAYWKEVMGLEPNARYEVNGFQFIAVSPEKGTMKDGDYMYALNWFEKELDAAAKADPEKPIFVFQHYPVSPTVYGGRGHDDWGLEDLFEALQRCPRVINFSGHTHYPINDPRCAWQGCFSAFGTGTLSYLCHGGEGGKYERYPAGSGNCGQFYVLEVRRDNSVTLKPYDLITNSFFDVVYYVAKPGKIEDYLYTDARFSNSSKPVWPENAEITLAETYEYGAICEFQQARYDRSSFTPACAPSEPVLPHSYAFHLESLNHDGTWREEPTQYFWSQYFHLPTPERLRVDLSGLDSNTKYRAKVYATNHFLIDSEKALEFEFQTKPDTDETVDRNAAKPDANVLALAVASGKLVNLPVNALKEQKKIQTIGEPKIVKEPDLGDREVVQFAGKGEHFKLQCDDDTYRKLRRASIRAVFKADPERKSAVGAVFGNTELRGIEISVNYEKRVVAFWASVNGSYKIAEAPIEFGKYVDVCGVYDGENVILYVDGKEVAKIAARGSLAHPTDPIVQAFCLGGDIAPGGKGSDFFTGRVACAQLFSWPLSAEQVANLAKK